jgi:hypothetical protein
MHLVQPKNSMGDTLPQQHQQQPHQEYSGHAADKCTNLTSCCQLPQAAHGEEQKAAACCVPASGMATTGASETHPSTALSTAYPHLLCAI